MKPNDDGNSLGPIPPPFRFVLDGPEEINLAKYPELANGQQAAPHKNIIGDRLMFDGPEEINDKMFPS